MTITGNRSGDSAPQSGHCCHGNLLRGELLGAAVSSGHHVGLEQRSLQVDVVVRQSLVDGCQHLNTTRTICRHQLHRRGTL